MSQKVLGGGLLVGVGYVLYQLFNSDENNEVKQELELKDVTKNILKDKNDFDLQMEKVDLDNQINEKVTTSDESAPLEETTSADEVTSTPEEVTSTSEEEVTSTSEEEVTTSEEEVGKPEEEVAKPEEELGKPEETIKDIPSDDSNTIDRIVRI